MRAVRALVSGVAVVAFVALGGSAGVSAQRLAACTGGWEVVQTPTPPNVSSGLSAVSAASSTDAWAIGFKETFIPPPPHAFGFLLHWDGASWTEVPDADPTAPLTLAGVVDIAPGDAWAVGFTPDFGIPQQPRVEHWDGVRWTVVATPSLADAELNAVTAISSTDVWAVGSQFDDQRNQSTLTEHWDGSAWSIVPSPNQQSNPTFLTAVAARASNDVFAAGGVFSGPDGEHGFVIRWNGTAWSTVRVPPLSDQVELFAVAANPGTVRVVGVSLQPSLRPFVLSSTGGAWTRVRVQIPFPAQSWFRGIAIDATGTSWIAGYADRQEQTLVDMDTGSGYAQEQTVSLGSQPQLEAASVSPSGDVWAVGEANIQGSERSLAEHRCT